MTDHTITDPNRLEQELDRVRRAGFAVDREEIEAGLMCIAAPVRDHTGNAVAAISMAGPVGRVAPHEERFGARVRATAEAVSESLGYATRPAPARTQASD